MLTVLHKEGRLTEKQVEFLHDLKDGHYLISVREIGEHKTEKDYLANYFALVDQLRDHQGDSRYTIHERFKKTQGVETTTDFTIKDWIEFISNFRKWVFKTLDLML